MQNQSKPLIQFHHVSKRFLLDRQTGRSLLDLVRSIFARRQSMEFFWPIRDLSFAIPDGVTIGVIGENGSGKSTLLKLISRILEPTTGSIVVEGRVSALLELGAGFHPELTGRENIYLHASLLGLKRAEIDQQLEQIIRFADIGPFIDTPVKHYSSGMYARLGFAIAIYVEPDVLLVDEVLAVGDESFQRRCLDAIQRLRARGVTILLVSHSLAQVLELCEQCIWLDDGKLMAMGDSKEVIQRYLNSVDEDMAMRLLDENARRLLASAEEEQEEAEEETVTIEAPPRRWGHGPLRIERVQMYNTQGRSAWSFAPLERVQVKLDYTTSSPLEEPIFSILIHKLDGHYLWASNTHDHPVAPIAQAGRGELIVEIPALALTAGRYMLSAAAYTEPDPPLWSTPSDFHEQLYQFQVVSSTEIHGDLVMPSQWIHRTPLTAAPVPEQLPALTLTRVSS
ncbi:MAG: ABC transporter ATP-binding protein [Caldilineaceae bacterium]